MSLRARRPSTRFVLIAVAVILVIAVNVSAALLSRFYHDRSIQESRRELQNVALVLGEQTDRTFQSLELIEKNIVKEVQAAGIDDEASFVARMSSETVHRSLRDKIGGLPFVSSVALVNRDGRIINFSLAWPAPEVDVSRRSYFMKLSGGSGLTSYVSQALVSHYTGKRTIYLAHRIANSRGEFLGLVLTGIEVDYLEKAYAAITLGPDSSIALFRKDGVLLARYPQPRDGYGRIVFSVDSPLGQLIERDARGSARLVSPIDGQERLISGQATAHYPLVVGVTRQTRAVLAEWHEANWVLGTIAALLNLLIGIALVLALRASKAQRKAAETAHYMARHDALTGLPNRLLLREQMEAALSRARQRGEAFALFYLDLDQFKAVNDTLGHPFGDALLRLVGTKLRTCVREGDIVARLGGDEFAIIQQPVAGWPEVQRLAERLLGGFTEAIDIHGRQTVIGISIGIVMAPRDGLEPDELLRKADFALYAAKEEGRRTFRGFDASMDARLQDTRTLELDLQHALARDELEVYLQPFIDLTTNQPNGYEALLRWHHPERGMVGPATFIPIAEANGLIVPMGEWVLRQACRMAAAWPPHLKVAVNLSPNQFLSRNLVEMVVDALRISGLDPARLELEITESSLLADDDVVLGTLRRLRGLGVRIALDDFGTGYSSLRYLTSFPFDRIKIDRSFVSCMQESASCAMVVRTLVNLSQALGTALTAEGVETIEQAEHLRREGCREVQGYLFGVPAPARDVMRSLLPPGKASTWAA